MARLTALIPRAHDEGLLRQWAKVKDPFCERCELNQKGPEDVAIPDTKR